MAALDVVEVVDVVANACGGKHVGGVVLVVDELRTQLAKELSATASSQQSPFRLMLAMRP